MLPVQGSVYLLAGGGSNVVVQVGDDAVFVVDTNTTALGEKVLAAIRSITKAPDPLHRQHVGRSRSRRRQRGAGGVGRSAGQRVPGAGGPGLRPRDAPTCASPIRPTAPIPRRWRGGRPMRSPSAKKTLFVTGEPIEIIHQPAAHTDGDVMVFFRKSDVVAAGDVFVLDSYPVIDTDARRLAAGRHRRDEPSGGHRRARVQHHGRHAHRPGPRPHHQRDRRRRVPRHADDHPRPDRAARGRGAHARAGEGGARVARLRRRLRHDVGAVDDRRLHRRRVHRELSAAAARDRSSRTAAAPGSRRAAGRPPRTAGTRAARGRRASRARRSVRRHLGARRRAVAVCAVVERPVPPRDDD